MPNALNLEGIALTREQGRWRRVAEKVARDTLAANAAAVDRDACFSQDNIDALRQAGLLGLLVPANKGGPDSNIVTAVLVTEALAAGCGSTAMSYTMHQSTVPLMSALCDEVQTRTFIEPLVRGELFGAFAMSEPGSGNRIWHMDSYAVAEEDGFLIDSFKSFCTSAGECDFYLVPVRGDADAGPSDLSLFFIPAKDSHIEPKGKWDGMGLRGSSSTPIHFNKCRVPAMNRLGPATAGFSYMMAYSLPIYLIGLSACYLGIAQSAFDAALAHVKGRVHSDTKKSLTTVETVQRYFAEMRFRIDQARATVLRVAHMADNAMVLFNEFAESDLLDHVIRQNPDDPFFIELAELKIMTCEMAQAVTSIAMQVCGGAAYKRGHVVERCYRDARAGSLMGPSDDTLKVIIGNQILGTPQPWA